MTLKEQLEIVERDYPDAWEYLHDIAGVQIKMPKFDDNDEVVSWGRPHKIAPKIPHKIRGIEYATSDD